MLPGGGERFRPGERQGKPVTKQLKRAKQDDESYSMKMARLERADNTGNKEEAKLGRSKSRENKKPAKPVKLGTTVKGR